VGFSWGAIDASISGAAETLNSGAAWYPPITADGDLPKGAWMAILTDTPDGAVTSRNCATANTPAWKITSAEPTPPGCSLTLSSVDANAAWLDTIMTATDLVAWAKLVGFTDHPELARCEIATFRYRLPHTAARITRSGRQLRLCIDSTWRWLQAIATAWRRIGTAFT
jgi:hypothetical protein